MSQPESKKVSETWSRCDKYCHDELFMHTLKSYFGVYFPHCFATNDINNKTTLSWVHKQIAQFYPYIILCIFHIFKTV